MCIIAESVQFGFQEHGRLSNIINLNSNCRNVNEVFVPMFGWIQEDAKMNDADADAAKADPEACGEGGPSG